ncbi:MAG TPA: alpha/beta hydrolase [Nitrospirota bacterium]|nr:alpha/beta hydrolase [Nitrospirota bacterium]
MRLPKVTIAYFLLFPLFLFLSGCGSLFFYPKKQLYDNPVARQFSPEDIYFKTSDGLTLNGWFFQAANAEARATVLVLHGNAENLSTHVNSVLWLVRKGFNLFIFDYRGYGKSQGSPDIKGVHLDAEAALKTVLSLPQVDKEQIIVLGQSIGGAIAVYTVAHTPYKDRIAALVIESTFSSYRLIAREKLAQVFITWPFQYPLSYLVSDAYSPIRWIREVSYVPVLIIHGDQDPVVPMHHGQMLYEAARDPKEFWETTAPGHVTSFADAGVRDKLVRYLTAQLQKM